MRTIKACSERIPANKAIVTSLREVWKKSLPEADLKLLRKPDEATFLRILAELETAAIVFQAAKGDGCSDETAYALTVGPSVYGHTVALIGEAFHLAIAREAVEMLLRGSEHNTVYRYLERKREHIKAYEMGF